MSLVNYGNITNSYLYFLVIGASEKAPDTQKFQGNNKNVLLS